MSLSSGSFVWFQAGVQIVADEAEVPLNRKTENERRKIKNTGYLEIES